MVSDLRSIEYNGLLFICSQLNRPEDIFGSLEVDGNGQFVGGDGNYQSSGMLFLDCFLGSQANLSQGRTEL